MDIDIRGHARFPLTAFAIRLYASYPASSLSFMGDIHLASHTNHSPLQHSGHPPQNRFHLHFAFHSCVVVEQKPRQLLGVAGVGVVIKSVVVVVVGAAKARWHLGIEACSINTTVVFICFCFVTDMHAASEY